VAKVAEEDNYIDDFISMQGLYDELASRNSYYQERGVGLESREKIARERDYDAPRGIISAKTAFAIVLLTSFATAVANPSWLLYTIPLTVFVVSMLSLAEGRRKKREPRRVRLVGD
jgi:hypothetical protein